MEVLDNLEKHFFKELPTLQLQRDKTSILTAPDNNSEELFSNEVQSCADRRIDLLRKVTREKTSVQSPTDSKMFPMVAKERRLVSTYDSFPSFTGNFGRDRFTQSLKHKKDSFRRRHILSLSDQNLSNFSLASGKNGLGFTSTSCTNLRFPLTSRSFTFDSALNKSSDLSSVSLPLLSRSLQVTTDRLEKNPLPRHHSELKLPSVYQSQLSVVEDEPSSSKEETRLVQSHRILYGGKPLELRDCVTPVRTAVYNVEHDWILGQEYDKGLKKIARLSHDLTIPLPDKEADAAIRRRLKEVKSMVTKRAELWHVWELMDENQKGRILAIQGTSAGELKKQRRKKWKNIDIFRNSARMCHMLVKAFVNRRAYAESDELPMAPVAMRRQVTVRDDRAVSEPVTRSTRSLRRKTSLGFDSQLAMSIAPILRQEQDLKLILWVLRATKAFYHLFPAEMETELAKVVAYERYDDGRIIAKQGRTPDRFYYIMTGKVQLVQEFVLNAGTVQKSRGFLSKGMTTDPNELENGWLREANMVAKGQVEVLLIEKSDFTRLQHTTAGPPLDFLRNLELFSEFPCELFLDCGDAFEVKYYSQNRVVVQDSNRTPWLHVIKSGTVKVIREQNVTDIRNDKLFSGKSADSLGCVRPFSHADAMLGILAQQRKMENEAKHQEEAKGKRKQSKFSESDSVCESPNTSGEEFDKLSELLPKSMTMTPNDTSSPDPSLRQSRIEPRRMSLINIPLLRPTEIEIRPTGEMEKKEKDEKTLRKAFLQLDLLKTGDVFGLSAMSAELKRRHDEGLEHMERPLASEAAGVILISDGAEVIKINKRFFLQHAPNNTMLKIETMQRDYMSEEEAISQLYNTETWHQYKTALMSRTIDKLNRL